MKSLPFEFTDKRNNVVTKIWYIPSEGRPINERNWHSFALHRVGGPAYYDETGYSEYRQVNVLHRNDGPAIKIPQSNGTFSTEWYFAGIRACDKIVPWLVENGMDIWRELTDDQKVLFKLKWTETIQEYDAKTLFKWEFV